MKKNTIDDRATKYMKAATKRFAANVLDENGDFVSGFTGGAHAGYKAGYKAAMKAKRPKRRVNSP